MLNAFLMGLLGGQRAMTPLAAVSLAAAGGHLPRPSGWLGVLARPGMAAATTALAAGELWGDKRSTAPDRIVPVGLLARFCTSAIAGAMLEAPGRRRRGAAVAGLTALAASWPGWRMRMASMPRFGQVASGLMEDAIVVTGAAAIATAKRR